MAWQSPASHSLYMALALSELIKRHFLTSPDAQREKKKSRERRKAPEGGTLLSLFTVWVNEDFSQCPLPFFSHSFSFLTFGKNCKHIYIYISAMVFFLFLFFYRHINSNYPQVKYVHPELGLFLAGLGERMRGLLKSAWPPSCRDPLEVVMKSVTLAQLYVSIHNPSPKT